MEWLAEKKNKKLKDKHEKEKEREGHEGKSKSKSIKRIQLSCLNFLRELSALRG